MTAAKRKVVGTRLLILGANLATIVFIVKVASISPIRAVAIVVASLLVVLVLLRRDLAELIHRLTGR